MKIKSIIFFLFLAFLNAEYSYSQKDTIKGKIYSSISKKTPKGTIYINEKGTYNGTIADEFGNFILLTEKKKEKYIIEIIAEGYPNLEYEYKSEWLNRKKPKSIVVSANCTINRETAREDWKNGVPKLYLAGGIAPIGNSKEDFKFEKKFKIKYFELGCELEIHECIYEYNAFMFKVLDIKYGQNWRNMKRNDIIGFEDYLNNIKTCIE